MKNSVILVVVDAYDSRIQGYLFVERNSAFQMIFHAFN